MRIRELWAPDHKDLLFAAAACCDAELKPGNRSGIGDPTEIAILMAALEQGIRREDIERKLVRRSIKPFDSQRKRMSVFRANNILYVKGALESVLSQCEEAIDGVSQASTEMAEWTYPISAWNAAMGIMLGLIPVTIIEMVKLWSKAMEKPVGR